MRRNTKFAGHLIRKYNAHSKAYIARMTNGPTMEGKPHSAEKHRVMMDRIRVVLEYRYNTIV